MNGTVTKASQSDVYSFTGTAGERTYFEDLSQSNEYSSADSYLYGPNNALLTQLLRLRLAGDSSGRRHLHTGGRQPSSSATGTYSFEAIQNVNPTSALTLGTGVTGTIANPGDSHSYTFTGSVGQRIYYDGLASAGYYLFAELTDPHGTTLFNNSSSADEGPFTLAYSGTYTLTVYSYATQRATGAYAFTLDDASAATSIALTPGSGTTESGTLATGLSTNLYQFTGTAGQSLYFQSLKDTPADAPSPISTARATATSRTSTWTRTRR